MTTNINITSSDTDNKTVQKTITGINPDATSSQLVSAAQKIVALTNDTYVKTDRVDKTNCDTESSKQTPTLTLDGTTNLVIQGALTGGTIHDYTLVYDGDGELYFGGASSTQPNVAGMVNYTDSANKQFALVGWGGNAGLSFKLMATETANYKAAEVTITITA